MDLAVFLLTLGLLLPAMANRSPGGYDDSWAVQVEGGEAAAKQLATKHGFTFFGQVRSRGYVPYTAIYLPSLRTEM